MIICQTRWWDHSGTSCDTQWHIVDTRWHLVGHTLAHIGHTVAHSVTYTLTWHSVMWITRACVAPQWNVRKCDTAVVTQAFSPSPSVLSVQQQTTPFFNHFPQTSSSLQFLTLTMVMKHVIPPDPIHQAHIPHQTPPPHHSHWEGIKFTGSMPAFGEI